MSPRTLRRILGSAAIAACLTSPAGAEDRSGMNLAEGTPAAQNAAPGGVAQFALAQDLHALGLQLSDALLVLTAARIASGVVLTDVTRERQGEAAPFVMTGEAAVASLPDSARMLEDARTLAGEDELLLSLADDIEAEGARGRIGGASRETVRLAAGSSDVWKVPFYGEAQAEIGVSGGGDIAFSVVVEDENGNRIWCPAGMRVSFYCDFTPRWNGFFLVTVSNTGAAESSYMLLTN
ncbi:hypothetical protein [Szabonella alba]|uniref:Uncharacterized protein n=1 Tax=Szabonella alba TaxID=2804194 RepID=A0A8K0VBK8_9RHOB|nr:hypothetical protein [Szabonella alba]MBL4916165.1 hypothetical protein [Szabonella alba]